MLSGFGWYVHVRRNFLPSVVPSRSFSVSTSASSWHGCVIVSMLTTGTVAYFAKRLDDEVLAVVLPALELRERADRDEVAVAREHAGDLLDVLLGLGVHHHAVAVLDGPGALAGLEDDGVAAHLEDADLERRARAQRRIEEDERDALAREIPGAERARPSCASP